MTARTSIAFVLLLIAAWWLFWGGVYIGSVMMSKAWLQSELTEKEVLERTLQARTTVPIAQDPLPELLKRKRFLADDVLRQASTISAKGLLIHPIVGPYELLTIR